MEADNYGKAWLYSKKPEVITWHKKTFKILKLFPTYKKVIRLSLTRILTFFSSQGVTILE